MSDMPIRPDASLVEGPLSRFRDLLVLRWLCQQYAARMDHLEVLIGRSLGSVEEAVKRLCEMDLVQTWYALVGEPIWVIPTDRGLRRCGLTYRKRIPRSTHLPHIAAINDVRLYIQMCSPETLWVPRRELMCGRPKGISMPDGLAIRDSHETAIEVRLETERLGAGRTRLERFERRYNAVVYFCATDPFRQMSRLQAKGCWPKLELRELPDPEEVRS
jgi:hypothetical protein